MEAANEQNIVITIDHEVGHQKFANGDEPSHIAGNKRRSSWLLALADLYVETFSPLFLLLPIMFVHIGAVRASIVFAIVWLLQVMAARLNFESTRLQRGNFNFARNEDFEELIRAPHLQKSWLITLFSKFYPIMLILSSAVAIIVCSMIADQLASAYYFKDEDQGKFLFGLLPALNEERQPVPNTELIKMSRGFLFFGVVAFNVGIIALIFNFMPTNREVSMTNVSIKLVAICALLVTILMTIPSGMVHNILLGNLHHINLPTGMDSSTATTFFYAGVLAFAEGTFPLKIIAIANSHNRSDLPLTLATFLGSLTRWIICILGSVIMLNKEMLLPGAINFALMVVLFFTVTVVISEIIGCQINI